MEKFRKIPILKEFEWFEWFEWFVWFEWFGPSPIEPFNSGLHRASRGAVPRLLLHRERERGVELGLLRAFGSHALGFRDLRCASCGAESFAMAEMTERTEI